MIEPVLRVAVLSDLHAYGEGKERPSFLDVRATALPLHHHPISSLKHLINKDSLTSDLLLCPGDLGHRASVLGIEYAWAQLHDVGQAIGAKLVSATAGNHDMDSRHIYTGFASDRTLKQLVPPFPLAGDSWDKYWARHYVIVNDPNYRLVLLNSSAYHGNTAEEKNHGRVDTFTLDQIKDDLLRLPPSDLNILLCHHHPQQHSEFGLGEDDVMKHGQQLLDLLGSGELGQWLVIHGHKHHPKITYASGSSLSPVVFAAGSFSFKLQMELDSIARNQFYILEFYASDLREFGLVGTARAWDWVLGSGWVPATTRSGLPSSFGFGSRDPRSLAIQVEQVLLSESFLPWPSILNRLKPVRHLLPSDFRSLEFDLNHRNIQILRNGDGEPMQIARMP